MNDPWLPLLEKLPLIRTEKAVVQRYRSDPAGRSFLPVADILRAHHKVEESLELLGSGVRRHPQFTVARVVYARELFRKGMVYEAWQTLEESPVSLSDNVLSQKIRFKLSILLGKEGETRTTLSHMKQREMLDSETEALADRFLANGFSVARSSLIEDLVAQGVDPALLEHAREQAAAARVKDAEPKKTSPVPEIRAPVDVQKPDLKREAEGFYVVQLDEVFRPDETDQNAMLHPPGEAMELDSTTLAEIYVNQQHYSKALAVYKRLMRMNPQNDFLKRKVADLTKLSRAQKDQDLEVDASLVDQMEQIEIIDFQLRYLKGLLGKLEH